MTCRLRDSYPGVNETQAWAALQAGMKVIHVHGSLGPYHPNPPYDGRNFVRYGGNENNHASSGRYIKLFWENGPDHVDVRPAMADAIEQAERIVFLGFGYLTSNMSVLDEVMKHATTDTDIWGTGYGLPPKRLVKLRETVFRRHTDQLKELKSAALLKHVPLSD